MKMSKPNFLECTFFTLALFAALFIQSAIPFLLTPTLGQAVWTTGFSHSFANSGPLEIYAYNIGAPEPAPIAFGLAGAWPAAQFIWLGLHAADAYAAMAALWLSLAFGSAYAIARHFKASRYHSTVAALCWMSMPVVWAHAGYSMLSLGIGLLSFYFFVAIKLQDSLRDGRKFAVWVSLYVIACIISVFMDGYSFMMFAVGSSIMIAIRLVGCTGMVFRERWALILVTAHALSFAIAYWLYAIYVGRNEFDQHSLDVFRGWGVDLAFMAVPTQGVHWLPDLLGWSSTRGYHMYWGDSSVWTTTFSIPLILSALWAIRRSGHGRVWMWGAIIVALFGFYMALGPSLKINTVKPPEAVEQQLMDVKYGIAPTGSAWISESLPGFAVMRASYRWVALGVFGAWFLVVLALSNSNKVRVSIATVASLMAVTLLNLPNPVTKWDSGRLYRAMFLQLDDDVLAPLKADLMPSETVAFLPWRNDFMVNYLASRLNIRAYNIGGDKNYQMARESWPTTMRQFPMGKVDNEFVDRVLRLFADREVDAVILPYIDMLLAAHHWPHRSGIDFRSQLESVVEQLKDTGLVEVDEREHYAVVRLDSNLAKLQDEVLKSWIYGALCLPPKCLKVEGFDEESPTAVGALDHGMLHSQGRAGFVVFGPYRPMDAGIYSLAIRGSGSSIEESWVDVVSDRGAVKHGKWSLKEINSEDGVGWSTKVELNERVKDLEIRIFAGAGDRLAIRGYELRRPANSGGESP